MKPVIDGENIRARCPDCDNAVTTFEARKMGQNGSDAAIIIAKTFKAGDKHFDRALYRGLRCAGCGRGALAVIELTPTNTFTIVDFFPRSLDALSIPSDVPSDLVAEFREAELTASVHAWRAASAMLRSTLEKTLKNNGYTKGNLADKIDEASADGVITEARAKRAHDDIRVLGNDVLHDAWRGVTQDEFDLAHKYTQRILEDLYDDRPSVTALLVSKKRLPAAP